MKKPALVILFLWSLSHYSSAQDSSQVVSHNKHLKVFLNCGFCYQPYLKTQITWADFVQDQFVADVDLLVATIRTGSGGSNYALQFTGQNHFKGMNDTLTFTTNAINTDAEIRDLLAQKVKLGLVRYAAKIDVGDDLIINSANVHDIEDVGIGSNPDDDPYNAWVFRINGNTNINAQKVFQSGDFYGNVSAAQVKENFKLNLNLGTNYSEQRFEFDGVKESYVLRSQFGTLNYVHSVSERWSAGVFTNFNMSDFSNYDYYQNTALAVEYDFFPYKEAQTKLITLAYNIGGVYFNFKDTTIFNETKTLVPTHSLNLGASFTQTWGSLEAGSFAATFLSDFNKYRYGAWMSADVRLFKGLSVSGYFSYNVIRDQINIRKGGASEQEVLLQQQELQTNYNFYTYFGISYRFGSIYNNVVNPRFNYG
ncbi:MAG: hypothetical protein ACKVOK_16935 [Flavobacteriales bacterium]